MGKGISNCGSYAKIQLEEEWNWDIPATKVICSNGSASIE